MIKLEVEGYCHDCLDFTPDVMTAVRAYSPNSEEFSYTDTIIQCEYRKRCANIERYLRQK